MTIATDAPATWIRIVIGIALGTASAVMLTVAMAPYGLWPLIWVGFVPMLLAQHRVMPPRLSSVAPAIGIGGFLGGYLSGVLFPLIHAAWYMKALPLLIGLLVLLTDKDVRKKHISCDYRWFVLHGAMAWVGIELIRSFVPVMATWAFVAYSLYEQPWIIQPVSVFGVFGLGLVIMLVNYTLALGAIAFFDQRWKWDADVRPVSMKRARRWIVAAGAALTAWIGLSLVLLQAPQGPSVRVATIQPDVSIFTKLAERGEGITQERADELFREIRSRMWDQTRQAARQGARFIVWPEGAIDYDPKVEHSAELKTLASETGAYLAIPYAFHTDRGNRNEITILAPDGRFLGVYGKDHPVTFLGETSITHGAYPSYQTPLGVLGTIICYDLDFTDTARKTARNGARLIAVPSWDWAGIAAKHYTHVVFRAVENRVAMIKSEWSYDSAIIDSHGNILARAVTPEGSQAILLADLPVGKGGALQTTLGDWVGWICLAGLLFFSIPNPITRPRRETAN